jgi:urease accessory protein
MIIREKLGNLKSCEISSRTIDWLPLEWYETGKRILHKRTRSSSDVTLKFLKEAPNLQQDDILYVDEKTLIAIDIIPCEVVIIQPATMYQMAAVCYEVGNKHLPLFYENDHLLIPYEAPIFRMLQAAGYEVRKEVQKLTQPLKTSVLPHGHGSSDSLFSKILKRTAATNDA